MQVLFFFCSFYITFYEYIRVHKDFNTMLTYGAIWFVHGYLG